MTKTNAQKQRARAAAQRRAQQASKPVSKPRVNRQVSELRGGTVPLSLRAQFHQRQPQVRHHRAGVVVRHTEYVGQINSGLDPSGGTLSPFNVERFELNPNYEQWPWLSAQAKDWEFYKFVKLKFHYVPRVAAVVTGGLMMAPDYDPQDLTPKILREMMEAPGAVDAQVWDHSCITFDPKGLNNFAATGHGYYVAQEMPDGILTDSIRLVESGLLFVATEGITNPGPTVPVHLGDLFVEYECILSIPNSSDRTLQTGSYQTPHYITQPKQPRKTFLSTNGGVIVPTGGSANILFAEGMKQAAKQLGADGVVTDVAADFLYLLKNGLEGGNGAVLRLAPGIWKFATTLGARMIAPTTNADTCLELRWQVSDDGLSGWQNINDPAAVEIRSNAGEGADTQISATAILKALKEAYVRLRATNINIGGGKDIQIDNNFMEHIEIEPLSF